MLITDNFEEVKETLWELHNMLQKVGLNDKFYQNQNEDHRDSPDSPASSQNLNVVNWNCTEIYTPYA